MRMESLSAFRRKSGRLDLRACVATNSEGTRSGLIVRSQLLKVAQTVSL